MSVAIEELAGRVLDLDSHYMILPDELREIWGPGHEREILAVFEGVGQDKALVGEAASFTTMSAADQAQLFAQNRAQAKKGPWEVKGWPALGAQDAHQRLEVLDTLGIARQLVFPTGMWSLVHSEKPETFDAVGRYNDFILNWAASGSADRLRAACLIKTDSIEWALAEVDRCLAKGARLFQFPCSRPWAGMSPGAANWDGLWARLAEARAPALFHLGSQGVRQESFVPPAWARRSVNAAFPPRFDGDPTEIFGPFHAMTINMAPETALMTMIFSGVFERHPDLRFGVIEMGAEWVAGWCQRMDSCLEAFGHRFDPKMPMKPSEYVRRQIRVTPYYFEKVGQWIRDTGLEEVYVFSTDYPHPEGGRDPLAKFANEVEPLGGRIVERFFVENALDILPA
jgi:predicted TIM-barrel fold metal-dependent hydrolase